MQNSKFNRCLSFILAFIMIVSLIVPAFATEEINPAPPDSTSVSNSAKTSDSSVPVTLQVVPANFSVTLPTTLPVNVDAEGVVTVADNATITNNKKGPIAISGVKVTPKNSWTIVPITSDFTKVEANAKQIGFSLLNLEVPANGILSVNALNSIPGNQSMPLPYGSKLAVQKSALSEQPLDVMFTIGWYTGGNNVADTDEALLALDKNYLSMMVGAEETITATYVEKATPKARMAMLLGTNDVTFTSTDTAIATVDANGLVTAVKEGTAKIIATANGLEAACDIKVNTLRVPLTAIDVNKTNVTLNKGNTEKLVLMYNPDKFTGTAEVTWSSNDTNIATVSPLNESHDGQSGEPSYAVITGVAGGNATIIVTVVSGSDTFNKTISVKVNEPMTDLTVSGDIDVKVGETANIIASKVPSNATDNNLITYESTDTAIATVDNNGLVTGIKNGNTTITVKCGYFTKTVNVVVSSYPEPTIGTTYSEGSYTYSYGQVYGSYWTNSGLPGWGVAAKNRTQTSFEPPLEKIQNYPVVSYRSMFQGNTSTTLKLTGDWKSSNVTDTSSMFYNSSATTLDLTELSISNLKTMASMFNSPKITTITGLENLNTSSVTNMSYLFSGSGVTTLNLSNFDTSNVTDMSGMFNNSKVTSLDLSSFNTSNVTNMQKMFNSSKATVVIELEDFDTSKVTNMNGMFTSSSIPNLNLNNWDTSNVTDMSNMFQYSNDSSPEISNWDTSNVTNMSYMFYQSKATEYRINFDISNWNTSKVTDMSYMFYGNGNTYGSSGGTLDIGRWNTSNVTNMSNMFNNSKIEIIKLTNWDTSNVTDMSAMFAGKKNTQATFANILDLSSFNTSNVTNMSGMFSDCNATTIIGLDRFNTSNVTNMSNMFSGSRVTTLDLSSFNTSKVTDMSSMFGSYNTSILDLSSFDTSKVTNMSYMFNGSRITTLDLSVFDTSKVTDMNNMFRSSFIPTLDLRSFEVSNIANINYMFYDCSATVRIAKNQEIADLLYNSAGYNSNIKFATNVVDNYAYLYDSTTDSMNVMILDSSQTIYNPPLEELDGKKVTSYNKLFYGYNKEILTLVGDWNNSNVTDMSYMFANSKIKTLKIEGNFGTTNVNDMSYMFMNSLYKFADLRDIDFSNVANITGMFNGIGLTNGCARTQEDADKFNNLLNNGEKFVSTCYGNYAYIYDTTNNNWRVKVVDSSETTYIQPLEELNSYPVVSYSTLFENYPNTTLTLNGNWTNKNITNMDYMFKNSSAESINLSNFNTSAVTSMSQMFYLAKATNINLSSFDTSNVTSTYWMFANTLATTLDLSTFNLSRVTNKDYMFSTAKATTGYARTSSDASILNGSKGKPSTLKFVVK